MAEQIKIKSIFRSPSQILVLATDIGGDDILFHVQIEYKARIRFLGDLLSVAAVEARITSITPRSSGDKAGIQEYFGDVWESVVKNQTERNFGFLKAVVTFIERNAQVVQSG